MGLLVVKGRLRTLSSDVESRKFKPRRDATGTSTSGVLHSALSIYHDVGYLELLILGKAMREPYIGISEE